MYILFVGSMVSEENSNKLPALSVAGNKMQLGILRGLHKIDDKTKALSVKPHRMFRKFDDVLLNRYEKTYIDKCIVCFNTFYINFIILKQISIFISLLINMIRWFLKTKKEYRVVLLYNTISYMVLPCLIACRLFKGTCVGIIADLPIKNIKKSLLRKIEDRMEIKTISLLDAIIPLSKYIASDFAKGKPFLVMEAGQTVKTNVSQNIKNRTCIDIVFSGTLNVLSGIELALNSFAKLDRRYVLHIYGAGGKTAVVKSFSEKYSNIIYHGSVGNDEMLQIQSEADILICPRLPDDFITKYTFPSKILEYMTSEVPVICNKLMGIPDEYYQFLNVPEKPEADCWAEFIKLIGEDSEFVFSLKAKLAKKFVLEEKNWDIQSEKIYIFCKKGIA